MASSINSLDNLRNKLFCILLCSNLITFGSNVTASEIRGKPYSGEFHFVEIKRKRNFAKKIPRVLLLPVKSTRNRKRFEERAFNQITEFFRNYNFVVPSKIEVSSYLAENEITFDNYVKNFEKLADEFQANYVVFLKINRISRQKKINAAGTLVAGVTVTGVGRYAAGEYVLKVYNPRNKTAKTFSAIERRKDHILGLFQSAEKLAFKLQRDTLQSLLSDFAQNKIKRSEGYILAPLKSYFPDSKGFE